MSFAADAPTHAGYERRAREYDEWRVRPRGHRPLLRPPAAAERERFLAEARRVAEILFEGRWLVAPRVAARHQG